MADQNHTIATSFGTAGVPAAPSRSFTEHELREILANPNESLTHDIARSMAQPHGVPYGYAAAMTKDGHGFAVAHHQGNRLSVFLKPDEKMPGAFWEINLLDRKFIPDENLAAHLHSNQQLYNATYDCLTHLKADGDDRLHLIEVAFAGEYRRLVDGFQAQLGQPATREITAPT